MTELEQTREVLRDLLEERGLPQWLAALVGERETLVEQLRHVSYSDETGDPWCCEGYGGHRPDCQRLRLLRLLDPDETQRQVDAAHADALQEDMRRRPQSLPIRIDDDGYALDGRGFRALALETIEPGMLVALMPEGLVRAGSVLPGGVSCSRAYVADAVRVTTHGPARVRSAADDAADRIGRALASSLFRGAE